MRKDSRTRAIARAIEYWVLSALVAGSMVYGLLIGLYDLFFGADGKGW